MARRSLRLSKPSAATGTRLSRRASVRARDSRSHRRLASQGRSTVKVVHGAVKRAMRRIALRDCGQRCVYCAMPLNHHTATLDHVVPLAHGGAHDPGNVVVACGPCNRMKGELLPFEFFARHAWAGANFVRYARAVHRALKRGARRAVSLAYARDDAMAA